MQMRDYLIGGEHVDQRTKWNAGDNKNGEYLAAKSNKYNARIVKQSICLRKLGVD